MKFIVRLKGGTGSGNFGHRGRSGEVGGSASKGLLGSGGNLPSADEIGNNLKSIHNQIQEVDALAKQTWGTGPGSAEKVKAMDAYLTYLKETFVSTRHLHEFVVGVAESRKFTDTMKLP